jgi:hypothetical protein
MARTWKPYLADYFQKTSAAVETVALGNDFIALNLRWFDGLKVQWSNNLADHFRLMDAYDDTRLCIFHHMTFLKHQGRQDIPKAY